MLSSAPIMRMQITCRASLFWPALLATLIFTVENWIFGSASWIYGYGSGLETIPAFLGLANGYNFAAWAPFAAGGVDRLAFWGNASPISPEMALFSSFPVWIANSLYRTAQYLIGIYFTARLLKDHFEMDRWLALVGGLWFGCFSYFTEGALLALPSVPFMIWALEWMRRRNTGIMGFALLGLLMTLTLYLQRQH